MLKYSSLLLVFALLSPGVAIGQPQTPFPDARKSAPGGWTGPIFKLGQDYPAAKPPAEPGVPSRLALGLGLSVRACHLTTRSTGPLAGGACAPSARDRLAWFVSRLACVPRQPSFLELHA